MNKRFPDWYYFDKEDSLTIRAKAALIEMRVQYDVPFPQVPGLGCFIDPAIRKEIDIKLGTGGWDGSYD